jgi:hypothetical protein
MRTGRTLAVATALVGGIAMTAPQPAHALSDGAAVGIGLGALAVGSALGAAANPYYGYPGYSYGYGYAPSYYYAPAPTYSYYPSYPAGQCWSGYYGRYVPC